MEKIEKLLESIKKSQFDDVFLEKVLRIERFTRLAKAEGTMTACILGTLIDSLTKDELKIVKQYLGGNFWNPGFWSRGVY
ncbi:MAG: hypothetical protein G01um101418_979 [Parcubacteria group bacterium Gr01-1014_18]|nr:MAG: hypothetical protein Greene041636_986 [Parcubacteria group bacterium Greene0416_36]TSC79420.1 MAG: hypothetical protein G01um101418_979 [Parcubacteria group bacterium Gr01-1014_18]TSC97806.1 MAG: hypothetical protein Greene101420_993 [Parcubacteria group bacterium Greene1014_20]TSD06016.1 MAG: hypothetical protein Greene07142_964 [Parcubacteria group bacterium Greene0714_2]